MSLRVLSIVALLAGSHWAIAAADRPAGFDGSDRTPGKEPEWNVWVEVLMVALPQEKAFALLPELQTPGKGEGVVKQLLQAIERKEATLTGWPAGMTPNGNRFVSEAISELRYGAGMERGSAGKETGGNPATATPDKKRDSPIFTSFETRNTGTTLEGEPTVLPGGERINLSLVAQRVGLSGWDSLDAVKLESGNVLKLDQPQFFSLRSTTQIVLRNGEWRLLAIHKLLPPSTEMELFIVRATATAAK